MAKKNVGSSFDDFLESEGLLEDATAIAVKRYVAFELLRTMEEKNNARSVDRPGWGRPHG